MKKYILSTIVLLACFSFRSDKEKIKVEIEVKQEKEFTSFTSICENQTNTKYTLTYSLEIEKKGKSGTSKNEQSGEIKVKPNKSVICSVVKLGLQKGDSCRINFKVYHNNKCISKENKLYIAK